MRRKQGSRRLCSRLCTELSSFKCNLRCEKLRSHKQATRGLGLKNQLKRWPNEWSFWVSCYLPYIILSIFNNMICSQMGLSNSVHWCSWYITSMIQMSFTSTMLVLILYFGNFYLFCCNLPFGFIFTYYLLTNSSYLHISIYNSILQYIISIYYNINILLISLYCNILIL